MRKFISLVLVALMLFMCSACGGGEDNPSGTNPSTDNPGTSSSETGSTGDNTDSPVTSITIADVKNHAVSPDSDFFCDDDGSGGLVLVEYLGSDDIVVIPETINGKPIVTIRQLVFANSSIKGIKISNSVTTIEKGAFGSNSNLEIVVCGTGLKTIGEAAFQRCSSLREVELNDGLENIGKLAFSYSEALKSIVIPESVKEINSSFYGMAGDFKIIGKAGSVAETYAASASITFEAK